MNINLMTTQELLNAIENYRGWIQQTESKLNGLDTRTKATFLGNLSNYQNKINDIKNELKRRKN